MLSFIIPFSPNLRAKSWRVRALFPKEDGMVGDGDGDGGGVC